MFSASLATMHFDFVLDFALLHIGLNCSTVSSSHRCGGLPSGSFRSLGYHSITARVYMLSVNLSTCPTWYSVIKTFTSLPNYIPFDVFTLQYSQNWSFHRYLCRNQSLFFLLRGCPRFTSVQHRWQNGANGETGS